MTAPLAIYVHWPYCARICPYCDFNVYRQRAQDPEALIDAIIADARGHRDRIGSRPAMSVFLGGGTPSLLGGGQIARLLGALDAAFPFTPDVEITLEANPEDRAAFADAVAAGVNRISLGVQALNDADLQALGRAHDAADALASIAVAAGTGARTSIDLIYARVGQTLADWQAELRAALALPVEHFSLYQLTIEPGTAFDRAVRRGRIAPPPTETAAALYEATQALCDEGGAPGYEVSNHARSAAAQSRHNRAYWEGADWLGLGPGAHGRIPLDGARTASVAARAPADYIAMVAAKGIGWAQLEPLSAEDAANEMLMMGLRLSAGIDPAPIEAMRGRALNADLLATLRAEGLLEPGPHLRVTPGARLVADRIAQDLCLA